MDRQRILLVVEYPNRKGQAVAAESLQERQDTVGMVRPANWAIDFLVGTCLQARMPLI